MKVLFACGGTAGHVNPAIAIADEFRRCVNDVKILFVGRYGGDENRLIARAKFSFTTIKIKGLKRSLSPENLVRIRDALRAKREAIKIVKDFSPDLIIGTGGYVCWPILKAGQKMGIPCVIHESNVYPGLATRLLARGCDKVLLNFSETKKHLHTKKEPITVGNPVRREFNSLSREEARRSLKLHENDIQIVSFGGSIGAERLNGAIIDIIREYSIKNKRIRHIHASGKKYYEGIDDETLKRKDGRCRIVPYIDNMPTYMKAADIVICRAGAVTLSEIAAVGIAAILIPSPNVTGNHQFKNAEHLSKKGAAILVEEKELESGKLLEGLKQLVDNRDLRKKLAEKAKKQGTAQSEKAILKECVELVKS